MILVEKENHNSDAEKLIVWALPAGLVSEWVVTTFAAILSLKKITSTFQVLTSCGYWETFTSEDSWTRVGQWLYEVEKFF